MPVKVSVIVPVYNPGPNIDACIGSVLRQSLPGSEYEAIFVDDGSTDGTGERLDALAAEHGNVTAIHIPNSGWPGRPRNVGIEAARGKYVYFVDNDDHIGEEALERLYDFAERNGSDIVIGKVAGRGRGHRVPREIFRRTRERATLEDTASLLTLLTPHKLFRRDFLLEQDIRFPEGRRRLEDHVFVMQAYFRATTISVLADYVCYYWVEGAGEKTASTSRFDPRGYYQNLREVLDIVEANTEPGEFRDRLLRHWYRGKMLGRLGGRVLLMYDEDYARELYDEIRPLALERFGEGVVAGLPMSTRVRSRLVREDRYQDVRTLAEVDGSVQARLKLSSAAWRGERLTFTLTGRLLYGDGTPVLFRRTGEKLRWELPTALAAAPVQDGDLDVTEEAGRGKVSVALRARTEPWEYLLRTTSKAREKERPDGLVELSFTCSASFDPLTAAGGSRLPDGVWDVVGFVTACGWDVSRAVAAPASPASAAVKLAMTPALVGSPARSVVPEWGSKGRLAFHVDSSLDAVGAAVRAGDGVATVLRSRSVVRLGMSLPAAVRGLSAEVPVRFQLVPARSPHASIRALVSLQPAGAGAEAVAVVPWSQLRRARRWEVELLVGTETVPTRAALRVWPTGRVSVGPSVPTQPAERAREALRRVPALEQAARRARRAIAATRSAPAR